MTLKEAEQKYPDLLTCNFMNLIQLEMQYVHWLSHKKDPEAEKELEALRLIKEARLGKG